MRANHRKPKHVSNSQDNGVGRNVLRSILTACFPRQKLVSYISASLRVVARDHVTDWIQVNAAKTEISGPRRVLQKAHSGKRQGAGAIIGGARH